MNVEKVLVPQRHYQTAERQTEKIRLAAHRRAQQEVQHQKQQAAADRQGDQIVRRLEPLHILRGREVGRLDIPAVLMDIVAILIDDLNLSAFSGKHRDGHVAHPGHKILRIIRHPAKGRNLGTVDEDAAGIIQRKAANGVIPVRLRQDPQAVGPVGVIRGGFLRAGFHRCRSGGEILRCIQRRRIEVPLVGYMENTARNVSIPDIQHAVLRRDPLNTVSSLRKNSLKQKHTQNHNGNRQKPAQQLFVDVAGPQGKTPFLGICSFFTLSYKRGDQESLTKL